MMYRHASFSTNIKFNKLINLYKYLLRIHYKLFFNKQILIKKNCNSDVFVLKLQEFWSNLIYKNYKIIPLSLFCYI